MRFIFALLVAVAVAVAAPASAQEAFRQVWVTQSGSGDVLRGRIVALSGDSIALLTPDHQRVEVPLDRVLRIEAHGDSLKNGAAIGAAIFAGLTLLACQGVESGGQCAAAGAFNIGFGALLGAGIDALNGGRTALYSRPAALPQGKTAGVQVRLRF